MFLRPKSSLSEYAPTPVYTASYPPALTLQSNFHNTPTIPHSPCVITLPYRKLFIFYHYESASGAKINLHKCKGLWSGSLKHRTDQLLNFDWYNTYIPEKILGTFFENVDCTRLNIDRRLQSLRNTIVAWKHRDLSFKGKALVINGLLTSTLWYTVTSVNLPPWAITDIETEIYNFF